MNPVGLIFVVAGAFSFAGALFNWDWFMGARKVRFVVSILTRTGARVFYAILGLFLLVLGVLITSGILEKSQ